MRLDGIRFKLAVKFLFTVCLCMALMVFLSACSQINEFSFSAQGYISQTSGLPLFIAVFLGGILSSLTPCVYPLIPITLALFGAEHNAPWKRRFTLAVFYVVGIAITYTILGMVSAKMGILFGSWLGHPMVVLPFCALIIVLGLNSVEIIQFKFLAKLQTQAGKIGHRGYLGAILAGSVSGIVASPCIGPVLVAVLGVAAATQNTWLGALLMFTYSLGFGVIFLLLGASSTLINKLPKSGSWLYVIKYLIAVLLFWVALFLLGNLVVGTAILKLTALRISLLFLLLTSSIVIATAGWKMEKASLKAISAFGFGLCLFVTSLPIPSTKPELGTPMYDNIELTGSSIPAEFANIPIPKELKWLDSYEEALETAALEDKLVMVDFTASWCLACKEYDSITFPFPGVKIRLQNYVLLKIDVTSPGEKEEKLKKEYGIVGLPSILFLDSDGDEIPESRITGFLEAPAFLQHIDTAVEKQR